MVFIRAHEPLRVNGNGFRMGLTLVIDANLDDCSVTNGKFDGFKVIGYLLYKLQDTFDFNFDNFDWTPLMELLTGFGTFTGGVSWCFWQRICFGSRNRNVKSSEFLSFLVWWFFSSRRFVGVKATTSFYTPEAIKEISPAKRQCLADGEKILKYFNHYSRSACFVECDANLMIERCQCRPYFFKGTFKNESQFVSDELLSKHDVCISRLIQ